MSFQIWGSLHLLPLEFVESGGLVLGSEVARHGTSVKNT